MPDSPEVKEALRLVKEASGITYGGSSAGIESMVRSVARRLLVSLSREELALLAGGEVPASVGPDAVAAEMTQPSASEVGRPPLNVYEKCRASGRGGDLWMRENKRAVNAVVAELQSASAGSRAPLKGKFLASLKKRVGWRLLRSLPKEDQEWWIEGAVEERTYFGFTPKVVPEARPAGGKWKGKPLKRKQDTSMSISSGSSGRS